MKSVTFKGNDRGHNGVTVEGGERFKLHQPRKVSDEVAARCEAVSEQGFEFEITDAEPDATDEVRFTSESAESAAREAEIVEQLEPGEGSGKDGAYTVDDVKAAADTGEPGANPSG